MSGASSWGLADARDGPPSVWPSPFLSTIFSAKATAQAVAFVVRAREIRVAAGAAKLQGVHAVLWARFSMT